MYYEYWNDQGVNYIKEVLTRPCTNDDFQIDSQSKNAKFFKPDETKFAEFKRKMNVLQCTEEPLNLIGNFNTGTAQIVHVMFEYCDRSKRKTCVSDKERDQWI